MAVDIHRPTRHDGLSDDEVELYNAIMDYRARLGLAPIPLSAALTATAGRHVVDTRENIWGEGREPPAGANYHSWSDAPYPADHSDPEVMWFAPQRIGTGYPSAGYEITGVGYSDGEAALRGWQNSPAHDAILANRGAWEGVAFRAIGVGVETGDGPGRFGGRVYHVWFGETPDAPPMIRGTGGKDKMSGTRFADVIDAGGGKDKVGGGGGDDRLAGGAGKDKLMGGDGADWLHGGAGADKLTGGAGADHFVFAAASESRRKGDKITDFDRRADVIDLQAIDARPDIAGDQAFVYVGGAARDGRGTLHQDGKTVWGDFDGDGDDDFLIKVTSGTLTDDDFLL